MQPLLSPEAPSKENGTSKKAPFVDNDVGGRFYSSCEKAFIIAPPPGPKKKRQQFWGWEITYSKIRPLARNGAVA